MKAFELTRDLVDMGGQFYPTGHIVAMFPGEDAARAAGRALVDAGIAEDALSLISPEVMMRDIARTVGNSGINLPSAGTEADTTRRFAALAAQDHWTLLVKAPDTEDSDKVMAALQGHPLVHAQKYRKLVIEDLA